MPVIIELAVPDSVATLVFLFHASAEYVIYLSWKWLLEIATGYVPHSLMEDQ